MFYLLWWLYGSWRWSAGVTAMVLFLQFHTDRPFFDPSSYVLRYPLLVATVALFCCGVNNAQRSPARLAALAVVPRIVSVSEYETGRLPVAGGNSVFVHCRRSGYGRVRWPQPGPRDALRRPSFHRTFCVAAFGPAAPSAALLRAAHRTFFSSTAAANGAWRVDWASTDAALTT
jgi:hypothetical protein